MANLPFVQDARDPYTAARSALVRALFEFEQARDALRAAKRERADTSTEAETLAEKEQAFNEARDAEASTHAALQAAILSWLPVPADDSSAAHFAAATADLERLEATVPIVLKPVRLETRFDGDNLLVRVFPDEIFLDTHERALTPEEEAAAKAYYVELNDKNNEKELWRDMIARFGVQRSAYILREMLPVFGDNPPATQWPLSSYTCGGTVFGGNDLPLLFPIPQRRQSTWTQPGIGVLPDRWAFVTYKNGVRSIKLGAPILEPLALTPDPKNRPGDMVELNGAPPVDERIRWQVDFGRALEVGMGAVIGGASGGFDRLIVVGVKTSMSAFTGGRHLEKLLDAHHYTRGTALVRQGSPTNNVEGQSTPYPPKENAGQFSYGIERQRAPLDREHSHHCLPTGSDGHYLAMALGVPSGVFANVDRAYMQEVERAKDMNTAVWPATLGYFMRHMMASVSGPPIFTPERIAQTKIYFREFVLARGRAPAFRVGGTPYGVLPIASLRHWKQRSFGPAPTGPSLVLEQGLDTLQANLRGPLRSLVEVWKEGVEFVPRILPGQPNPDDDVARVLSTYPSAREFRVRPAVTEVFSYWARTLLGDDPQAFFTHMSLETGDVFDILGHPEWRTRIGFSLFGDDAALYTGHVVAPVLSEDMQLSPNFLFGIAAADVEVLNLDVDVFGKPAEPSLLYMVMRHATLMEYWRSYYEMPGRVWEDPPLFGVSFARPPQVSPLYDATFQDLAGASEHRSKLERLGFESTAELERLFTETMDLTSHRLDAWVTSFAARRLNDMREANVSSQLAPREDFFGGYGWLEDLKPRTPGVSKDVPGIGLVETQALNGGFVQTPSMSHAAAAAVLRNAHLSVRGENASAYAIDLSSRRVRKGRRLFEAVRNGQPVGAVLGYEFERRLHEELGDVEGMEQLRFTLRSLFPLVANKAGSDPTEPAEAIAARNVIDGSLLLRAHENEEITWGSSGLPTAGTTLYNLVTAEIERLNELYDATADLLTAEAVFQLVRGNIDAAVPTLNNVAEGKQPPDTIVSRSARGGIGIAHRVAMVFPSDAPPELSANFPAPTARALAEPILNAWLGQLVGDPANVRATVTYLDAAGDPIQTTSEGGATPQDSATITLVDLRLHPLDLLALSEVVARENQGSVLERRIAWAALEDPVRKPATTPARVNVSYAVSGTGVRGFPEVLEVLSATNAVLAEARPLGVRDVLSPAEADEVLVELDEEAPSQTTIDFRDLCESLRAKPTQVASALTAALASNQGYLDALRLAAELDPQATLPPPLADETVIRELLQAVLVKVQALASGIPSGPPSDAKSSEILANGVLTLKALFGQAFPVLPGFEPPRSAELGLSLAARSTLLTPAGASAADDEAPDRYLQQIMRSRARLGRYRRVNLYARTVGVARPRVSVVQLPHTPGERWLGLPYDVNEPPEEGRVALLLLNYESELDATVAWSGFVIDDWSEVVPNPKEETGVAFHYDGPRAQAPQAVLVATPSGDGPNWSFDELLTSLEETMDLMQIRAVDRDHLSAGQIFPATMFASNPNPANVVSTQFAPLAMAADAPGLGDG
jgi:hypothetical protein